MAHTTNDLELYNIKPKFDYEFNGGSAIVHICDSIHYNAIKNNDYTYYKKYIKNTNQKDHNLRTFMRLQNNFNLKKIKPISIKFNNRLDKYIVSDGCHRLSILVYKKYFHENNIPKEFLKIKKV